LAEILSDLNEEELAQLAALTDRAAPLDIKQVVDGYWLAGRQSRML
jgi:hypothetical protein